MRVCLLAVLAGAACGPEEVINNVVDGSVPGAADGGGVLYFDAATCATSVPIMIVEVPTPPDVLLVVDKSGSMRERLTSSNPTTKWEIMRNALNQIVMAEDQAVYFGLSLYPTNGSCGAGTVLVDPAAGNYSSISTRLNQITYPDGSTPTHTTLDAMRSYYQGRPENPNGRYVLLATDGEPNCGPGGSNDETDAESVNAVRALAGVGIKTYVIGFGSGTQVNPTTLQNMAIAGETMQYYQASTGNDLVMALEQITMGVMLPSCTYELVTDPEDPTLLLVTFDGMAVSRSSSHTNGWDYDADTNSISFYGPACDELQSGSVDNVHVDYGCEGPAVD